MVFICVYSMQTIFLTFVWSLLSSFHIYLYFISTTSQQINNSTAIFFLQLFRINIRYPYLFSNILHIPSICHLAHACLFRNKFYMCIPPLLLLVDIWATSKMNKRRREFWELFPGEISRFRLHCASIEHVFIWHCYFGWWSKFQLTELRFFRYGWFCFVFCFARQNLFVLPQKKVWELVGCESQLVMQLCTWLNI